LRRLASLTPFADSPLLVRDLRDFWTGRYRG
jgi:hypothetical protein